MNARQESRLKFVCYVTMIDNSGTTYNLEVSHK